jgi:hypothetical protein
MNVVEENQIAVAVAAGEVAVTQERMQLSVRTGAEPHEIRAAAQRPDAEVKAAAFHRFEIVQHARIVAGAVTQDGLTVG